MSITSCFLMIMFVTSLFVSYLTNAMKLWEFALWFIFALPIYLYMRNGKVFQMYNLLGIAFAVLRYYTNHLLWTYHQDKIVLPISMEQPLIKQFTGLTVLVVCLLWYAYVWKSSYNLIKTKVDSISEYNDLVHNKSIIRYINFFSSTSYVLLAVIIISVFGYRLEDVASGLLLLIIVVVVTSICFYAVQSDMIRKKKEVFVEQLHKDVFNEDVKVEDLEETKS